MRVASAVLALVLAPALGSCLGPPPSHALVVRHPELKCALIAFSGCGALAEPSALEPDEDAGFDDEDAGVERE